MNPGSASSGGVMRTSLLGLLLMSLVTSCSSPPPPPAPPPAPVSPRIERLNRLWLLGTGQGDSPAQLQRSLGRPASIHAEAVPNRHVDAEDTLTTVTYPGRRFKFLFSGANHRQFLIQADLDDGDVPLPGELHVGRSDVTALRAALCAEESMRMAGDTLILSYRRPDSEAEDHLEFAFLAGRLQLLRWLPYVD